MITAEGVSCYLGGKDRFGDPPERLSHGPYRAHIGREFMDQRNNGDKSFTQTRYEIPTRDTVYNRIPDRAFLDNSVNNVPKFKRMSMLVLKANEIRANLIEALYQRPAAEQYGNYIIFLTQALPNI
jgi:hypothetical protein